MCFNLMGANRNDENRLSGSEQTQCVRLGDTDPSAIDFGASLFREWTPLYRHLAEITPAGLEEHHPLEHVVVVRPSTWGDRVSLRGRTLVWPLFDQHRQALLLAIPFDDINKSAIEALEQVNPAAESPWGLVGRVTASEGQPQLWPYALIWDQRPVEAGIQNLNLDAAAEAPMSPLRSPSRPTTPKNCRPSPAITSSRSSSNGADWKTSSNIWPRVGPGAYFPECTPDSRRWQADFLTSVLSLWPNAFDSFHCATGRTRPENEIPLHALS